MKKISALILVMSLFAFICFNVQAKVILKSGNLDFIKSEKVINIKYDYSSMKVGSFNTEEEYINDKLNYYNEKEPGKGEKWKEGWVNSREERYEPKFEELFNKYLPDNKVQQNASGAKYTLIVKTVFIEPGFHVGVMKKPASVNFEFIFVDAEDESKIITELYLNGVIGSQAMGYDFDVGSRIAESYAKGGKELAKFILKKL